MRSIIACIIGLAIGGLIMPDVFCPMDRIRALLPWNKTNSAKSADPGPTSADYAKLQEQLRQQHANLTALQANKRQWQHDLSADRERLNRLPRFDDDDEVERKAIEFFVAFRQKSLQRLDAEEKQLRKDIAVLRHRVAWQHTQMLHKHLVATTDDDPPTD